MARRPARGQRVGVYGLDYVMTVRDYRALAARAELVPWDVEFDLARAVKSDEELESVRESVRINTEGFRAFLERYAPGARPPTSWPSASATSSTAGCGRLTMNMVLAGPEFAIARSDDVARRLRAARRSRSPGRAATGSRSRARSAQPNDEVRRMLEAYEEYFEAARTALRRARRAHDVHRAVSQGLHGARLQARPRHRPLDRDDDDRAPEDRRGRRDRARRGDGLLDAPARDLRRTARVPLHAGHVARRPRTAASRLAGLPMKIWH